MIDSEQQLHIRNALRDSRREGLINFVEEFITLLDQGRIDRSKLN
ncbi:MAG: hypothetical protein V7L26_11520 [Nostoc sp.]